MLELKIKGREVFDDISEEFVMIPDKIIRLEHSLVSISKWEAKWLKPFLSKEKKTIEESIDYIKCMTITQNVSEKIYNFLSVDNLKDVEDYIDSPMSAKKIHTKKKNSGNSDITSDDIYYLMVGNRIPIECQKWHLNRLLVLLKICSDKNAPPEKISKSEILSRNRRLNAERRKALNTKG